MYVLHKKNNKNNRSTKYKKLELQNPFIQQGREAGRGAGRVNGTGRKRIRISPGAEGLANARKELQKNPRALQTHAQAVKVHRLVCREIAPYVHRRQESQFLGREHAEGPWQSGSRLPWRGRRTRKGPHSLLPVPLI